MGTFNRQSFKWEHSTGKVSNGNTPGKFLNGDTQQEKFQMRTLSRLSFKWEHLAGKVSNGNTPQAKF